MGYLPEKYYYSNEVNGRSVYALTPNELYETLNANKGVGPKTGQYIYVRSFGNMRLIFVAPYSVRLYMGNAQFYPVDSLSTQIAIELAIASRATVVFPLRTFYTPSVDPDVQNNPLLCTLADVIEKLGAALVVEVRTRDLNSWGRGLRGGFYLDDELGLSSLGWPRLVDTLQLKCAPTRVLRMTAQERIDNPHLTGLLPLWVRKTYTIPSLSLNISTDFMFDPYNTPVDDLSWWEREKADFVYPLPEITYHAMLVKRERDRRGSISFEDELRLSGGTLGIPAPSSPFPGSQPSPAESENIEERS